MDLPELVPAESLEPAALLEVINQAFHFERTLEWFRWKHTEGPWGPSRGLAAVDRHGVAAVRLLLPWRFRVGGRPVLAWRAVEAATAPRAQGRGFFSRLNSALMGSAVSGGPTLFFSTPNANSRPGYMKLGWTLLGIVRHIVRPVIGRRLDLAAPEVLGTDDGNGSARHAIRTDWRPSALRWRTDARSGRTYESATLVYGSHPNGLIYRVSVRRGIRFLVLIHAWGPTDDRRRLVRAAVHREGAHAVLEASGDGAVSFFSTIGLPRGGSHVAIWTSEYTARNFPTSFDHLRDWSLSFADVEGVL